MGFTLKGRTMQPEAFIADMNGLQRELASLPPEATRLIGRLMEMVEIQQGNIETLLAVNTKLLLVIDRLKG
jgi:hypothetical protein